MTAERILRERPNQKWTIALMAGALYSLKEEFGKPINPKYLEVNHPMLMSAIYRNYGWKMVVEYAGFDPEEEKAMNLKNDKRAQIFDNDY